MFQTMFRRSLAAAALAGLALSGSAAFAQTGEVRTSQRVSYSDLDLASAKGQATFEARLRRAASSVCEANYGPHPLSEAMESRRCYRNALSSARASLAAVTGRGEVLSR